MPQGQSDRQLSGGRDVISWIMHHHREERSISLPALNYFKMLEILKVLFTSGPLSSGKLRESIRLIHSNEVLLSYLDVLEDLKLISREKRRFGGGFAPMKSSISITKNGEAFVNGIERGERPQGPVKHS
jgi:hypothetical protein